MGSTQTHPHQIEAKTKKKRGKKRWMNKVRLHSHRLRMSLKNSPNSSKTLIFNKQPKRRRRQWESVNERETRAYANVFGSRNTKKETHYYYRKLKEAVAGVRRLRIFTFAAYDCETLKFCEPDCVGLIEWIKFIVLPNIGHEISNSSSVNWIPFINIAINWSVSCVLCSERDREGGSAQLPRHASRFVQY